MAESIAVISGTGPDLSAAVHGAKACGLQILKRRGLPVPPAFVIPIGEVERVVAGELRHELESAVEGLTSGVATGKLAVRSGAEFSLPGALETVLGVDYGEVAEAVALVAASTRSPRASAVATVMGLQSVPPTAVVVQLQVDATADDLSGAGAALSRDPLNGSRNPTGSYASRTRGDLVMAGTVAVESLDGLASRSPGAMARLTADLTGLDSDLGHPVELEFVVESGQIWYLQLRKADITESTATRTARHDEVSILGSGRAASAGRASGELQTNVDDALDAIDSGRSIVLALETTSPADVEAMTKASAVITVVGGPECHAAVVARASGVPAVVSVSDLVIAHDHVMIGPIRVDVGEVLVVDGTAGTIASATVAS